MPIFFQRCIQKADDLKDVSANLFEYVGLSTAAYAVKKRLRGHLPVVHRGRFHYDNRNQNRGPAPVAPTPVIVEIPTLDPSEAAHFSGPWRNAQVTPSVASLTSCHNYAAPEMELRPSILAPVRVQSAPEGLDAVAAMKLREERQPEVVRTEPPPPGSS